MRLSVLLLVLLAGCARANYVTAGAPTFTEKPTVCQARFGSQLCVTMKWEKLSTETDFGSFLFKIYRQNLADGSPVVQDLAGEVSVVLWMPGMGHGSSPVTVQRLDVGTFRASKVFFTMRGEWDIRVQLKEQNGLKDQAIISLTF